MGLESIQEDCLDDPAICSDISDDEARIEVIEQAEFERLEAALERSFGKAKFKTGAVVEEERENDPFFDEPCLIRVTSPHACLASVTSPRASPASQDVESATEFLGKSQELAGISSKFQSKEGEENYERTFTNAHPKSPKKGVVAGTKWKNGKRSFTIEEGRQEIEKRLNEMRRTEIDQVLFFLSIFFLF